MSVQALAEYVVCALVDDVAAVDVSVDEQGEGLMVRIDVAEADRGALIGRGGRTIRALEVLLAVADRDGRPVAVDLVD